MTSPFLPRPSSSDVTACGVCRAARGLATLHDRQELPAVGSGVRGYSVNPYVREIDNPWNTEDRES